ncbi:MAG: hypothetical protein K1X53_08415 [Candidatus Sumerlaeaceae bacterium]|nr:hypothetical protein [Candidatus Sumerlaeaceae bacterium]
MATGFSILAFTCFAILLTGIYIVSQSGNTVTKREIRGAEMTTATAARPPFSLIPAPNAKAIFQYREFAGPTAYSNWTRFVLGSKEEVESYVAAVIAKGGKERRDAEVGGAANLILALPIPKAAASWWKAPATGGLRRFTYRNAGYCEWIVDQKTREVWSYCSD